jgi:hypothetical protein
MYWYAARRWPDLEFLGEDLFLPFRGFGEGVEDALLVSGDRIIYALEHAGSYRPERVRHFHQHVAIEREIPYFIF